MQSEYSREEFVDLEQKMPEIIEYFVAFYGEKYRELITEKLSGAIFMFVCGKFSPYDKIDFYKDGVIPPMLFREMLYDSTMELINPLLEPLCEDERKAILKTIACANSIFSADGEVHPCLAEDGTIKNFVYIKVDKNTCDHTFVHELVHVVETALRGGEKEQGPRMTCGISTLRIYGEENNHDQRTKDSFLARAYENQFNELLTEYKAMQISKKMKEDGFEILNDKKSSCCYRESFFVTESIIKNVLSYANDAVFEDQKANFIKLFGGEEAYAEFNKNLYRFSICNFITAKRDLNIFGIYVNEPEDILDHIDEIRELNIDSDYLQMTQYFYDMSKKIESNIEQEKKC